MADVVDHVYTKTILTHGRRIARDSNGYYVVHSTYPAGGQKNVEQQYILSGPFGTDKKGIAKLKDSALGHNVMGQYISAFIPNANEEYKKYYPPSRGGSMRKKNRSYKLRKLICHSRKPRKTMRRKKTMGFMF